MARKTVVTLTCDLCGDDFSPSEYGGRTHEYPDWGGRIEFSMAFDKYGNGLHPADGPSVRDLCKTCNDRVKNVLTKKSKKEG